MSFFVFIKGFINYTNYDTFFLFTFFFPSFFQQFPPKILHLLKYFPKFENLSTHSILKHEFHHSIHTLRILHIRSQGNRPSYYFIFPPSWFIVLTRSFRLCFKLSKPLSTLLVTIKAFGHCMWFYISYRHGYPSHMQLPQPFPPPLAQEHSNRRCCRGIVPVSTTWSCFRYVIQSYHYVVLLHLAKEILFLFTHIPKSRVVFVPS